jgi:hypothetical protein
MKGYLLIGIVLAGPVFLMALVFLLVGAIGARDWRMLAAMYPAGERPEGVTFRFRSLEIAYSSTHMGSTFVVSEAGLYVAGAGPFRLGRPAMLIPWSAMEIQSNSLMLETWIRVTPPSITLRITPIVFNAASEFIASKKISV